MGAGGVHHATTMSMTAQSAHKAWTSSSASPIAGLAVTDRTDRAVVGWMRVVSLQKFPVADMGPAGHAGMLPVKVSEMRAGVELLTGQVKVEIPRDVHDLLLSTIQ